MPVKESTLKYIELATGVTLCCGSSQANAKLQQLTATHQVSSLQKIDFAIKFKCIDSHTENTITSSC